MLTSMKPLAFALFTFVASHFHPVRADKVEAPVLTIQHAVVAGVKKPTTTTRLYAGGRWTYEETDPDGKQTKSTNGTLGKDETDKIVKALDAAPWTITHPRMHCNAMAQTYTVFTAGNHTFTEKLCGTDILDDKTKAALDDADKQLSASSSHK